MPIIPHKLANVESPRFEGRLRHDAKSPAFAFFQWCKNGPTGLRNNLQSDDHSRWVVFVIIVHALPRESGVDMREV